MNALPSPEENTARIEFEKYKRLVVLSHPEYGSTFLIDITDREDPSSGDELRPDKYPAEKVKKLMKKYMDDKENWNKWQNNNGVIGIVTDKFAEEDNPRVYIGIEMFDPNDEKRLELTTTILESYGFGESGGMYVPMSFDSSLVQEILKNEMQSVVEENNNPKITRGIKLLLPKS
jgi:hypothetical protein